MRCGGGKQNIHQICSACREQSRHDLPHVCLCQIGLSCQCSRFANCLGHIPKTCLICACNHQRAHALLLFWAKTRQVLLGKRKLTGAHQQQRQVVVCFSVCRSYRKCA